jgi:hypothetical protein
MKATLNTADEWLRATADASLDALFIVKDGLPERSEASTAGGAQRLVTQAVHSQHGNLGSKSGFWAGASVRQVRQNSARAHCAPGGLVGIATERIWKYHTYADGQPRPNANLKGLIWNCP